MTKRKPYMTELLTYLALRPNGATVAEVTDTFAITDGKAREYTRTIRRWLGTNPRTGEPHLPDARSAPSKATRGASVYEIIDILIDIDLFRRLRLRGQARGANGITDLITALRLVDGSPFDYPPGRDHSRGWSWLIDGDRIDQHIKTAIIDVAHIITTHALATGDTTTARMAAETAALAVSSEEIPHLDLVAVATAEGNHAEASRILRDQITNRTDDDLPPPDLPDRTTQILRQQHNRQRAS